MRNKMMIAAIVVAAVTALGCGAADDGPGGLNLDGSETSIVLEVTGADGAVEADVTFGTAASQSQENGVALPWRKELTDDSSVVVATVLAQNKGGGSISCKITVDGVVVEEATSSGEFAVVTCTS